MLNRLNTIPMDNNEYTEELQIITQIAQQNGFSKNTIDKLNSRIVNNIRLKHLSTMFDTEEEVTKFITLEYNRRTSNIIKKIFKKYNYTVAHKTSNKIQHKLKPKRNNNVDSGVYKLTCNDCPKFYIGQTGRTFEVRFKEHTQELNHAATKTMFKSNYAHHLKTENHSYTDIKTNLQILHHIGKSDMLDRLEELEIYKQRHNTLILNEKISTKAHKLYDSILYSR